MRKMFPFLFFDKKFLTSVFMLRYRNFRLSLISTFTAEDNFIKASTVFEVGLMMSISVLRGTHFKLFAKSLYLWVAQANLLVIEATFSWKVRIGPAPTLYVRGFLHFCAAAVIRVYDVVAFKRMPGFFVYLFLAFRLFKTNRLAHKKTDRWLRGNTTERVATSCIKATRCFPQHHSILHKEPSIARDLSKFSQRFLGDNFYKNVF